MKVILKKEGRKNKKCKLGFSWTMLFFGFIPLLMRGMYIPAFICFLTFPFGNFLFACFGNRLYVKKLTIMRYEAQNEEDKEFVYEYLVANDYLR